MFEVVMVNVFGNEVYEMMDIINEYLDWYFYYYGYSEVKV